MNGSGHNHATKAKDDGEGKEGRPVEIKEKLQAVQLSQIPCYPILQRLTNNAGAITFYAARSLWPELFIDQDTTEKRITKKVAFKLMTSPLPRIIGEIRIAPDSTKVIQRRILEFKLIGKMMAKIPKQQRTVGTIAHRLEEMVIHIGFMWLQTSIAPFKEKKEKIHLQITNLVLEKKIPQQYFKHRKIIQKTTKRIIDQLTNYPRAQTVLLNGASLVPGFKMSDQGRLEASEKCVSTDTDSITTYTWDYSSSSSSAK